VHVSCVCGPGTETDPAISSLCCPPLKVLLAKHLDLLTVPNQSLWVLIWTYAPEKSTTLYNVEPSFLFRFVLSSLQGGS
jgi:hypothetical protein